MITRQPDAGILSRCDASLFCSSSFILLAYRSSTTRLGEENGGIPSPAIILSAVAVVAIDLLKVEIGEIGRDKLRKQPIEFLLLAKIIIPRYQISSRRVFDLSSRHNRGIIPRQPDRDQGNRRASVQLLDFEAPAG